MSASEEAKIVDSRDDIAKLIGGPASAYVNMMPNPVMGYVVYLLWVIGHVLGCLSFVKLVDDAVSIACPIFTTPGILYLYLRMTR